MDQAAKSQWDELQRTLGAELTRRQAAGSSDAKLMRGFDDFCREQTARFLFSNPSFASDWIAARTTHLTNALGAATTEEDYRNLLISLSDASPLAGATSECPQYALLPPTLKPRSDWHALIEPFHSYSHALPRLLQTGFMPIPSSSVEQELGEPLHCPFVLVDTDYGIALLPPGERSRNISLDTKMFRRYTSAGADFTAQPSDVFDVGCTRGEYCLTGRFPDRPNLISLDISSRAELGRIVERVQERAHRSGRFEVWFRGQPQEYILDDLTTEAEAGLCPWRSVQDISQVPSLYRALVPRLQDLHSYCQRLLEVHQYYLFIKEILGVPTFTVRYPGSSIQELFAKPWGLGPELTGTLSSKEGEVIESHDTHESFRSLQAALFLQHYGLESNILDLTTDLDIALFFAQTLISQTGCRTVDHASSSPIVYVFILDRELDPIVNTGELLQGYALLRPQRQHCGILAGASLIAKNYCARFVSLKLRLTCPIRMHLHRPEHLFPGPEEDTFLRNLLVFKDERSMKYVKPFVLGLRQP